MVNSYLLYKTKMICESFDTIKKNTDFTSEQLEVLNKINYVVNKNYNENRSKLKVLDYFIDKSNTCVCVISGGLNGPGEWANYFEDLAKLIKDFEDNGINAWYIEGYNDCPDDVFVFNFGVNNN